MISTLATSSYLTSKHWGWRDGTQIKYIIPHHMQAGWTGAYAAQYFVNNGIDNSTNYCIGYGGDISCNVLEEFGAWTSSFSLADKYAITIEVSDVSATDYHIPDAAKESLIKLMVDLIQRYPSLGEKAVFDPSDESEVVAAKRAYRNINAKGNILLHKWTSAYGTACPGKYMIEDLPDICKEVNRRLEMKRSLREEAQFMLDNNINGQARKNQAIADGFKPEDVQAEIDLMLAKNSGANVETMIKLMPSVKKGDTGEFVLILQNELKAMGYMTVAPDGIFGNYTHNALIAFQKNIDKVYKNFAADGVCGQVTWTRILLGR